MRCIIPPHWSQAGPSSRSAPILAGTTGGVSVSAAVAGFASAAVSAEPFPPPLLSPFEWPLPPFAGAAASSIGKACWASFFARTSSVRMPSCSR